MFMKVINSLYLGLFINNKLNGLGEKFTSTGNYYKGEFKDSYKHGRGYEENNEYNYEGEFSQNKKHGKGFIMYTKTGESYEGEFQNNHVSGTGKYTWANQDTYEGSFLSGMMHGKGLYKWKDGGEYYGDYQNNIKEGKGIFKWVNGRTFIGGFKDGKPHGEGEMIYNQKKFKVNIDHGKIQKIEKDFDPESLVNDSQKVEPNDV